MNLVVFLKQNSVIVTIDKDMKLLDRKSETFGLQIATLSGFIGLIGGFLAFLGMQKLSIVLLIIGIIGFGIGYAIHSSLKIKK